MQAPRHLAVNPLFLNTGFIAMPGERELTLQMPAAVDTICMWQLYSDLENLMLPSGFSE